MKYLKCAGVALGTNLLFGSPSTNKFLPMLKASFLCLTIPAIGATAIDKLVHQNLFDNKPLQYALLSLVHLLQMH